MRGTVRVVAHAAEVNRRPGEHRVLGGMIRRTRDASDRAMIFFETGPRAPRRRTASAPSELLAFSAPGLALRRGDLRFAALQDLSPSIGCMSLRMLRIVEIAVRTGVFDSRDARLFTTAVLPSCPQAGSPGPGPTPQLGIRCPQVVGGELARPGTAPRCVYAVP
jgi:hypothetical protein